MAWCSFAHAMTCEKKNKRLPNLPYSPHMTKTLVRPKVERIAKERIMPASKTNHKILQNQVRMLNLVIQQSSIRHQVAWLVIAALFYDDNVVSEIHARYGALHNSCFVAGN